MISRDRPEWFNSIALKDDTLGHLLDQLYRALDAEIDILAAIGLRTAFDRVSALSGIDPNLSFEKKLNELLNRGFIGQTEKDIFSVLVDAGSAAAHRGWRPETDELHSLMDILEHFIERNLHTRNKTEKIAKRIPPKGKAKGKAP